ncbi:MAG: hypothetical protein US15_C0014G0001, partial [Candidatus Moranbacteria bacterium GW2011_GWF1_36_4]
LFAFPYNVYLTTLNHLSIQGTIHNQSRSRNKIIAQNEAVVSSGKGNETLIKINSQDFGTLSEKTGPVKDVVFNLDSIKNLNN